MSTSSTRFSTAALTKPRCQPQSRFVDESRILPTARNKRGCDRPVACAVAIPSEADPAIKLPPSIDKLVECNTFAGEPAADLRDGVGRWQTKPGNVIEPEIKTARRRPSRRGTETATVAPTVRAGWTTSASRVRLRD